jgi:hypothetical protein
VSFSDANLTTSTAVRYLCLVSVLLALPFTANAQQRVVAGARPAVAKQPDQPQAEQRRDEPRRDQRQSDQRQADQRQADRRQNDRANDRRNDRANDRPNDRPVTGLGPIGLPPVQNPRLPWWEQRQTPWWEQQRTPAWEQKQVPVWEQKNPARAILDEERDRRRLARNPRPHHTLPPIVYVLPPYRYFPTTSFFGYGVSSSTVSVAAPPPNVVTHEPLPLPMVDTGILRLEVEPRNTLQVFVDGLYVGTPGDLGDEIELRLGARRIELRAPGYRTLIFDTEIVPERAIIYRGALEPATSTAPRSPASPSAPEAPKAPEAPQSARPPTKMYLIPGCYLGNVAPEAATLRAGCDIKNLIVSP